MQGVGARKLYVGARKFGVGARKLCVGGKGGSENKSTNC